MMDEKLKVIFYNCQSFNANATIIQNLLSKCDVLCLQETLIGDYNYQNIDTLNNNFVSSYIPAYRKNDCLVGRASGGLVILWKPAKNVKFFPLNFDRRIMGLKITSSDDSTILLLNVYMPCDYGNIDSALDYQTTLAKLENIFETESFDDVCIVGDFNADPNKGRFYRELLKFSFENSLQIFDVEKMPSESYTYVSQNAACSSSWLDHICTSNSNLIMDPKIMYGQTFYDHIPVSFDLIVALPVHWVENVTLLPVVSKVNWETLSLQDKQTYSLALDDLCLEIFCNVLNCSDPNCCKDDHLEDLNALYFDLIECIELAALFLPSKVMGHNGNRVVGWNNHCKQLYKEARVKFLEWHSGGKIRMGPCFEDMKVSRTAFKKALNYCRKNETYIKRENILQKFSLSNKAKFWKEISKINGKAAKKTVFIDGKSNLEDITAIFDDKYKNILNDPLCQGGNSSYENAVFSDSEAIITLENVNQAIFDLNIGSGWDGIHANHFKFSGPVFRNLFMKFLNKLLNHSFVPKLMVHGEIRPVIKNNVLSKNDSNNYRPVMNSAMSLKILEYCILPLMLKSLRLGNHQFGFRKDTSCLSAISLAKETILKYNSENTNVHAALIDCTKAFDRINKNILFDMLSHSGLDNNIVGIIKCMYDNTYVNTLFNGIKSESWKIGNGVRQGGILSPLLFGFYINETLEQLSDLPMGCSLLGYKTGVICYADDILLLSPSATGLQSMLNSLSNLLSNLCLTINPKKSNYIVFKYARYRYESSAVMSLGGVPLTQVNSCKYLGVFLTNNGDLGEDVDRATAAFLKQFYAMYAKFKFCDQNVLLYLFRTFTSSFYGIDLWFEKMKGYQLNKISVAYHKAVKSICKMNVWDNNHAACEIAGVPVFKHLLAKRLACFWHTICYSKSPCMANLKFYFRHKSHIAFKIESFILENYSVNIRDNPLCTILSRIKFVEKSEPRSNYVYGG